MTDEEPDLLTLVDDDTSTPTKVVVVVVDHDEKKRNSVQKIASSVKKAAKSAGDRGKEFTKSAGERGKEFTSKGVQSVEKVASSVAKAAVTARNLTGSVTKTAKKQDNSDGVVRVEPKVAESRSSRFLSTVKEAASPLDGEKEASRTMTQEKEDPVVSFESANNDDNRIMDDHMIVLVVVASIAVIQTLEHWQAVVGNQFPIFVVLSWMLVAFSVGLEVDSNVLLNEFQTHVLGFLVKNKAKPPVSSFEPMPQEENVPLARPHRTFLGRVFRRDVVRLPIMRTSLRSSRSMQERQQSMIFDANLMKRLSHRFRRRTSPAIPTKETEPREEEEVDRHGIGAIIRNDARADVLRQKMDFEPLFKLRGVDVFLTDCAEQEMGTHPFLIKNGLRDVPTFMLNLWTQWGSLLIYFEMPSWVKDFNASIVEEETDAEDVKALKRFLSGDDNYRKARLKLIPELVEASYPVRLMAPSGKEIAMQNDGIVETSYRLHDSTAGENLCPVFEVTLDFMGNSTIRGMASLVKRYLPGMSVDFCAILSKPAGQTEDEPEACLGLWRLNHIDVTQYATLPDRFSTDGCSQETVNALRASLLIENARLESSKHLAVAAE